LSDDPLKWKCLRRKQKKRETKNKVANHERRCTRDGREELVCINGAFVRGHRRMEKTLS
jgi:hypothetical protein